MKGLEESGGGMEQVHSSKVPITLWLDQMEIVTLPVFTLLNLLVSLNEGDFQNRLPLNQKKYNTKTQA